jgi:hypothetical protein
MLVSYDHSLVAEMILIYFIMEITGSHWEKAEVSARLHFFLLEGLRENLFSLSV